MCALARVFVCVGASLCAVVSYDCRRSIGMNLFDTDVILHCTAIISISFCSILLLCVCFSFSQSHKLTLYRYETGHQ